MRNPPPSYELYAVPETADLVFHLSKCADPRYYFVPETFSDIDAELKDTLIVLDCGSPIPAFLVCVRELEIDSRITG